MFFSHKTLLLITCSATMYIYAMNETNSISEQRTDLTREIVIKRSYNSIEKKKIIHSLVIDFGRYVYAFLKKKDNSLWFNFQNGATLEKNHKKAYAVFNILTKNKKPSYIKFTPKTHAYFETVNFSNKELAYGAQIISLSELKYFKYKEQSSIYNDLIFDDQQFYMRPSPSNIIPKNATPLANGTGFSGLNIKGETLEFIRVKLFPIKKKITIKN